MYSTVLALSMLFNCQEFKDCIVENVNVLVCKWLGEILLNRGGGGTVKKLLKLIDQDLGDGRQHDSAEFLIKLFERMEENLPKDSVKQLEELFSVQTSKESVCQSCQTKKDVSKESNFLLQIG